MKKKLFVVASLVSLYMLFVFAITAIDKHGKVSQLAADVGLADSQLFASLTERDVIPQNNDLLLKSGFRDPMPPPLKKPKPRRKSRRRR